MPITFIDLGFDFVYWSDKERNPADKSIWRAFSSFPSDWQVVAQDSQWAPPGKLFGSAAADSTSDQHLVELPHHNEDTENDGSEYCPLQTPPEHSSRNRHARKERIRASKSMRCITNLNYDEEINCRACGSGLRCTHARVATRLLSVRDSKVTGICQERNYTFQGFFLLKI